MHLGIVDEFQMPLLPSDRSFYFAFFAEWKPKWKVYLWVDFDLSLCFNQYASWRLCRSPNDILIAFLLMSIAPKKKPFAEFGVDDSIKKEACTGAVKCDFTRLLPLRYLTSVKRSSWPRPIECRSKRVKNSALCNAIGETISSSSFGKLFRHQAIL